MADTYNLDLLSNAAATGTAQSWPGGDGVFAVRGTFGGATVKLQWSEDGTNWWDADKSGDTFTTFTAAGSGRFGLPKGTLVRASVSGGSPSALYAIAKAFNQ